MSERIEKIRNNNCLKLNDIMFGRVIATELYNTSLKDHIKHLTKCLFYDFTVKVYDRGSTSKLFLYSLGYTQRKDYEEIRDQFLNYFVDFTYIDVDRKESVLGGGKKLLNILYRTVYYFINSIPTPFLCAVLVTEYFYLFEKYKQIFLSNPIDVLVTFCDARCEDNLLTQMAMQYDIKTATLQHGQYRILDIAHENADAESYKNFISDYLLAWGKATKDEFIKVSISEERIHCVGALKPFSFNKKIQRHEDKAIFGVILCGDTYEKSNISMIQIANKIAKEYNCKYYLRLHPRNNMKMYMPYIDKQYLENYLSNISNEEYTSLVDFSLIHMTGVFVEILSLNSIVFVYSDEYLEPLFKIGSYFFRDLNEFHEIYQYYKDNKEVVYEDQYKYYHYFNEEGDIEENYKKAIGTIMKGEK